MPASTHSSYHPRARRALIAIVLAIGTVRGALPVQPAAAQSGLAGWRTVAGGDEIITLAVNPRDPRQLWAGTEGGGVVVWDVSNGDFEQHVFPTRSGLDANDVYDIAFDSAGDAWLATAAGVTLAAGTTWQAHRLDADDLPAPPFTAIAAGTGGTVWAGGPDGLASLELGVWLPHPAVDFDDNDPGPHDGPGQVAVADIAVGPDGRVYVAHGRAGSRPQPALSIYEPALGEWTHVAEVDQADGSGPRSRYVMALAFDSAGTLWMATWGRGVLSWDGQTWEEHGEADGVCGDRAWAIHTADRDVWVACGDDNRGEGVARWDGTDWQAWSSADGLATDLVGAIATSGTQAFFGTNGMGDDRPDATGGLGIIPFDGARAGDPWRTAPATPWSNDVTALLFEPDGTLWVGTRGAGLMRRRTATAEWEAFTVESTQGRLPGDTISDLALRNDAELWVSAVQVTLRSGAYVDGGVGRFDLGTDAWDPPLRHDPANPDAGLPDDNVGSLAVDDDGRVWMGFGDVVGGAGGPEHQGAGAAAFDPDRGTWERFRYDRELAGDTVVGLAARGGEVWAASSYHNDAGQRRVGGGVSRFDGAAWSQWARDDDGFKTFHGTGSASDRDGLIAGDVRSVFVDRAGGAWAGTYSLDDGQIISLWPFVDAVINRQRADDTWENGVFTGSGWVSAIAETSLGEVWVGTTRGHFDQNAAFQEHSPKGYRRYDTAEGGVRVRTGGGWTALRSGPSGLASNAVTALALDPTTGEMWVGTENGGLSVYAAQQPLPTPTPGTPTVPPAPTSTAIGPTVGPGTLPPVVTRPPAERPTRTPRPEDGDDEDDEPEPPPEVPEPTTLLLFGAGAAGLAGWAGLRRRARR